MAESSFQFTPDDVIAILGALMAVHRDVDTKTAMMVLVEKRDIVLEFGLNMKGRHFAWAALQLLLEEIKVRAARNPEEALLLAKRHMASATALSKEVTGINATFRMVFYQKMVRMLNERIAILTTECTSRALREAESRASSSRTAGKNAAPKKKGKNAAPRKLARPVPSGGKTLQELAELCSRVYEMYLKLTEAPKGNL